MEIERKQRFGWIDNKGLGEVVTGWLFKENLPYKEICKRLKEEYNLELSVMAIANYRKFVIENAKDMVQSKPEYYEKLAKVYLNSVENLVYALNNIKEKIDEFQDPTKWKQQSTYLMLLLNELHLLLKRSGEIKPSTIIKKQENIQTFNMLQINNIIQTEIARLIDEGQIPLEQCSDQIKQFYRKAKEKRLSANT